LNTKNTLTNEEIFKKYRNKNPPITLEERNALVEKLMVQRKKYESDVKTKSRSTSESKSKSETITVSELVHSPIKRKRKPNKGVEDVVDKNEPKAKLTDSNRLNVETVNRKDAKDEFVHEQLIILNTAQTRLNVAYTKARDEVYLSLQSVYEVYSNIKSSPFADELFETFRNHLKFVDGIKVQKNTTEEGLLIRYVWKNIPVSAKNQYDYSCALSEANRTGIKAKDFAKWLKTITITGAVEAHKRLGDVAVGKADRMARARALILRLLEAREPNPISSFTMTANEAQKMLNQGSNTCVMIGTATRKMDRDSFYASVNLTLFLPTNIDIDTLIINRFAEHIQASIDVWEDNIKELEEKVWADNLYEYVTHAEMEQQNKEAEWWQNRIHKKQLKKSN